MRTCLKKSSYFTPPLNLFVMFRVSILLIKHVITLFHHIQTGIQREKQRGSSPTGATA